MQKILKSLTALVLVFLLAGCIEVSEDVWINSDASSRLKVDVGISEKIARFSGAMKTAVGEESASNELIDLTQIKNALLSNPNVKNIATQQYSQAGMWHFAIDVQVPDFRKLSELSETMLKESKSTSADGKILATALEPGTMRFEQDFIGREVNTTPVPDSSKKAVAFFKAVSALIFGDKYITVALHAPNIMSGNGKVSEDQKTMTWSIPLSELGFQANLEAEVKYASNWWEKASTHFN